MFVCRICGHKWEQECKDGDHLECPKCGWKFIASVKSVEWWEKQLFPVFDALACGEFPDVDDE